VLVKKAKNILRYHIAVKRLGYHGIDLTKRLGLSESGVVLAARRGEVLYESIPELREIV
jgi:putative transposase